MGAFPTFWTATFASDDSALHVQMSDYYKTVPASLPFNYRAL